jgi:hypothetical protein
MEFRLFSRKISAGEHDGIAKKYRIGFSTRSSSVYSMLIRRFTRFPASHAFIFYDDRVLLDASGLMVKLRLWRYFKRWNYIVQVFEIKRNGKTLERALERLEEHYGAGYDIMNVIGMVIVRLVDILFHKKIKNFLGSKNQFQCSEFVYMYLHEAGIGVKPEDPDFITPRLLFDFCMDNKSIFKPVIGSDHETDYNISRLYFMEHEYDRALKFIDRAVRLSPGNNVYERLQKRIRRRMRAL